MCCILENYQTAEGVTVPECLRPFMGGVSFIPYNEKCVANFFKAKAEAEKREAELAKKGGNKAKEAKAVDETKKPAAQSKTAPASATVHASVMVPA